MFSPAELLKQYLGDAFNLEGVPDANNVRTWEKERHDLARNVLNILRSNNSGRFQLDDCPKLLIDHSSRGNVRLHDAFASYVEVTVLRRCNDALAALIKSNDEPVRRQALSLQRTLGASKQIGLDDVLRLLDQASNLQVEAKRLGNEIVTELNKIINLLLNTHRQLLREIALALPKIRAEVEDDEDDEDEEAEEVEGAPATSEVRALHALTGALRGWARAIADGRRSISGRSGRIIDLLGSRLPDDQRFGAIGVRIATRSQLRTIVQAPRDFVLGAPRMYAQFRREALRKAQHFSAGEETGGFVARNRITRDEVDVLLLTMLRNARRLLQYDIRRLDAPTPHDWLETIKGRYLLQVFVDEATDLSAVGMYGRTGGFARFPV